MEAIHKGRGSGSLGRSRSSRIGHELATILLYSSHDYRRHRLRLTTIGPQSGVDRAPDPPEDVDQ